MAGRHFLGVGVSTGLFAGRALHGLVLSVGLATVGYLGFALWGGWRGIVASFVAVGPLGVAAVLALSLVNYGLRFARWQSYLSLIGMRVPALPSAMIYVAGFSLTTTPGKAGELLRGVFLKQRGMPYTQSAAAFVSERLSDLVAIVLLAMLGVGLHPQGGTLILSGAIAVVVVLAVLSRGSWLTALSARLARHSGRLAGVCRHGVSLLVEARCCHTPGVLAFATLISLLAWSAEAYAFYLILHWMGAGTSVSFSFAVYALAMLAGALSFLPGGLGGAEAVMSGLLLWSGMPEAQAVAATVLIRLGTLWFAVSLGVLVLLLGKRALHPPMES